GERLQLLDGVGVIITTLGILAVQLSRQPDQGSSAST
ncbi:MAG: EamA/RhaT family transporter, partial [Pseudomonadota bacterium]